MSFLMVPLLFAAGCATPPPTADTFNPMPAIWAEIAAEINTLKKINATQAQWAKAAASAKRITTPTQFHTAIACLGSPPDDAERQRRDEHLEQLFRTSHRTFHYSWECDFSAIVFFDASGHPKYVAP
jgi:hypothetical protein